MIVASAADVLARAPAWGRGAYEQFAATMLSNAAPFPCMFAVGAFRRGHLRYAFVDSTGDEAFSTVREALLEFMAVYRRIGRYTSLVTFFRPDREAIALCEHRRRFWNLLQFLHEHDPQPWPERVPATPDDPHWQFCFAGEDIFVVCNTPAHRRRRSRSSACMTVFFQPMWTFAPLLEDPVQMLAACRPIRSRLETFDGMGRHPALGMLGEPDNREWRHYFMPDDNTDPYGECPFRP